MSLSRPHQARTAVKLLNATGTASASVIAARVLAFANPATSMSPWHRSEAQRMSSEKIVAGSEGLLAVGVELAMLPARMLQVAARPSTWTPSGWMNAWVDGAGLWIGIGNAGLRPAKATAVRNRTRLMHRTR